MSKTADDLQEKKRQRDEKKSYDAKGHKMKRRGEKEIKTDEKRKKEERESESGMV